ncbi:MAG: DUF2000 domain-containing protein [Bacteroidetes bacterium]|nr:DUF2000 domain-containing protein [Bacteroidota bacterium]
MKLIALLNKEISLGKSLNALAHISIGLGHRINGTPEIDVYFGNSNQLYDFHKMISNLSDSILMSDFVDTMTEDTASEQLERTKLTKEKDLKYFAICCLMPSDLLDKINSILNQCQQLSNYNLIKSTEEITINPKQDIELPKKPSEFKLAMIISKKADIADILNPIIQSCLIVGINSNLKDLHLLNFVDGDGNSHYGISFHNFPVLTAKNNSKHKQIDEDAKNADLIFKTIFKNDNEEEALVTTIFGLQETVNEVVPRKITSLFNKEIDI